MFLLGAAESDILVNKRLFGKSTYRLMDYVCAAFNIVKRQESVYKSAISEIEDPRVHEYGFVSERWYVPEDCWLFLAKLFFTAIKPEVGYGLALITVTDFDHEERLTRKLRLAVKIGEAVKEMISEGKSTEEINEFLESVRVSGYKEFFERNKKIETFCDG